MGFWSTVPAMQSAKDRSVAPVPQQPAAPARLPAGFEWCRIHIDDAAQLAELSAFLNKNYVEASNGAATFRMQVTPAFLRWLLAAPGRLPGDDGHIAVRANGKLMGFLAGTPAPALFQRRPMDLFVLNFLCVHRKLRGKRMLPVLVREAIRVAMRHDVPVGIYTSPVRPHEPVATCTYHQRVLDAGALTASGFADEGTLRFMQVAPPTGTRVPGLRPMTEADVPRVAELLRAHGEAQGATVRPAWRGDDDARRLLPVPGVLHSFVVAAGAEGVPTDVISFYVVVLKTKAGELRAAHQYYHAAGHTPLPHLVHDALVLAARAGCHLYNALDIGDTPRCFARLGFVPGSQLNYLMTNLSTPCMSPAKMGMILP